MSLTIKIWNTTSGSVTIQPEWSMREPTGKVFNLNRTPAGTHTLYTYATFNQWKLPLKFIPSSAASFINSLFLAAREARLEMIEDGVSSVYSVMITNARAPLYQVVKPLVDYWQGELELSVY